MSFVPSVQQAAFLNWVSTGSGSCVLEAVAGAGKTTTLIEAIARTGGGVAILAYNKKIATEIGDKLKARGIDWKTAEASTVHAFGMRTYRKAYPRVKVDTFKVTDIIALMLREQSATFGHLSGFAADVAKAVGLAKQRALGVMGKIDDVKAWFDIIEHFDLFDDEEAQDVILELIAFAQAVLLKSNANTDIIDFDDMIYMPLIKRMRFWGHKWVFVDEAQDTNPARRAMIRAMLAPGGRVVAVGDRHQAIYGFTGADADSLDLIAADFNAIRMPLTTTYRCPQNVVAFAQQWVNHIECGEGAPVGSVSNILLEKLMECRDTFNGSSAILCRNTKPLVALAFQIIRANIACRVEGRDIGIGLIKLATKWKKVKTLHGLEVALEKWEQSNVTRALAKRQEAKAQEVMDKVATLQVIIEQCRSKDQHGVSDVVAAINALFSDNVENMLTLSTIHKSKGREWNTVYWLDRANTLPSPYARQQWQFEQEDNLCYVAATRAKSNLVEVLFPTSEMQKKIFGIGG